MGSLEQDDLHYNDWPNAQGVSNAVGKFLKHRPLIISLVRCALRRKGPS